VELWWLSLALLIPLLLVWVLLPVFYWRRACSDLLESQIARTSFQYYPGQLVPPMWRPGEVSLSVVVPAMNEAERLPYMLQEAMAYLEDRAAAAPLGGFTYEIIVVDSRSSDDTYNVALRSVRQHRRPANATGLIPQLGELRVLELTSNLGKGFAARVGMLVARGDLVLLADADGATRMADVERLEQALEKRSTDGSQIAFGSRYHLHSEWPSSRRVRETVFSISDALAWLFVGMPVYDAHCGFKLFRARAGKALFSSLHLFGWSFDIELIILTRLLGIVIVEVPVTYTDMPGSKFNSVTDSLAMLRDTVLAIMLYLLRVWYPSVLM